MGHFYLKKRSLVACNQVISRNIKRKQNHPDNAYNFCLIIKALIFERQFLFPKEKKLQLKLK